MAGVLNQEITDRFAIYNADCMDVLRVIPSESIHGCIYSPPFTGLYRYSSSDRDLSNARSATEFATHYGLVIDEIERVMMPGRTVAVHAAAVPSGNSGKDSLDDFPGDVIRMHQSRGFDFIARHAIWKEPLAVRNRTMAKNLAHKTIVDDAAYAGVASADELLIFRKRGASAEPIIHPTGLHDYAGSIPVPAELSQYRGWEGKQTSNRYSHWIWRRYASSVWDDIRIDRVLPFRDAKDEEDEKHVHPAAARCHRPLPPAPHAAGRAGADPVHGRWIRSVRGGASGALRDRDRTEALLFRPGAAQHGRGRPRTDGPRADRLCSARGRRGRSVSGVTITDLFCGAGGSSSGAIQIPGVRVRMAANHWKLAIDTHNHNHPDTDHDIADISQVDPRRYPRTDILWASPECTNHSQAKGIKRGSTQGEFDLFGDRPLPDEAAERSRATMWDVPRFAEHHQYDSVIVENVVDAAKWIQFPAWLLAMELLGYEHETVWLNSMHAQAMGLPAPQSRDRMYVVFWRRGNRRPDLAKWTRPWAFCHEHGEVLAEQVFKKAERWGRYRAQYVYRCPKVECRGRILEPGWLPAASVIDWDLRGQRIGDREKPLADKTRERIRRGIERYWRPLLIEAAGNAYDSTDPKHYAHGDPNGYVRAWPTDEVMRTLHTSESKALVVNNMSGADQSRSSLASDVLPTQVAGGTHASLLVPVEGREGKSARTAVEPMRTMSTRNETGLLMPYYGRGVARTTDDALNTVTAVDRDGLLVPLRTNGTAAPARDPMKTVVAGTVSQALVVPLRNHGVTKPATHPIDTVSANGNHHALLMRNNTARGDQGQMSTPGDEVMRTVTTSGHQSLLDSPEPLSLEVDDCEFRMLTPDEIKRGMAFGADYVLLGTKREQVRLAGNAVTPPAARDLIAAVVESLGNELERVA
ncbi:MAG: DNA cytosine methyltransferase [Pseudolysinimonas sp.]